MKTASINELKQELNSLPSKELLELCLRLARFKKENKELLSYLLFESQDEQNYISNIKLVITGQFLEVNQGNLYQAKKSIRKILRTANKYIKYTGSSIVEVEVLIHFCLTLKQSGIKVHKNTALLNLYNSVLKKIDKAVSILHEDLQYDYEKQLKSLEIAAESGYKSLLKIFR